MPRETIVGNGRIAVAFDNSMNVRDFFLSQSGTGKSSHRTLSEDGLMGGWHFPLV